MDDGRNALYRRRRTVERVGLTARFISAAVALPGFATYHPAAGTPAPPMDPVVAGVLSAAALLLTNVFAFKALKHLHGRRYRLLSAGQVAVDTAVVLFSVWYFLADPRSTTWPVLALPIVVAAVRQRLVGALVTWAVTSSAFAAMLAAQHPAPGQASAAPSATAAGLAIGLHLFLAIIVSLQNQAYVRQLRELERLRSELTLRATHDPLTRLPNRALLYDTASSMLADDDTAVTVLLLDLDGFKQVNDTLGHAAGDALLKEVAERLRATLAPGETAARLGGDEFAILSPTPDGEDLRSRVGATFTAPFASVAATAAAAHRPPPRVGASIGLSTEPPARDRALDTMLADADTDMYAAKARRRDATPRCACPTPADALPGLPVRS
ncbi:GGDEF domain-containing protein [Actinoplanes sp. NPDC049316]|uniref:GGDEF domain-containing protein n=1 Tax=Actinoplanes sp. NPDC049316 TaxID=3154727 RepID=UPI00342361CA